MPAAARERLRQVIDRRPVQGIGRVAHPGAVEAAHAGRVEHISLDQEVIERAGAGGADRLGDRPAEPELGRSPEPPARSVLDVRAGAPHRHPSREIGQPVQEPRSDHRKERRGLERPEVDAGLAVGAAHIRPEVHLEEAARRVRQEAKRARLDDLERNQRHPGRALEEIELERRGHERTERARRHRPVEEQELAPALEPKGGHRDIMYDPEPSRGRRIACRQPPAACGMGGVTSPKTWTTWRLGGAVTRPPPLLLPEVLPDMIRFFCSRIAQTLAVLFTVSVIIFALMRMIPGDPVLMMLGRRLQPGRVQAAADEARPRSLRRRAVPQSGWATSSAATSATPI